MNREVQSVLLILLGSAITRISLTDVYLRYVKSSLQPFLVATGVILLVLGVMALIDVIRSSRKEAKHKNEDANVDIRDHAHAAVVVDHAGSASTVSPISDAEIGAEEHDGHGHGEMRIAWLLLLPVLSILLVAPPALGAYSADREQTTVLQPVTTFDPMPPGDPVAMPLNEYAIRAVWDDQKSLEGRTVLLEGFVTQLPDGSKPAGLPADASATWLLTRLALSCCAADATVTKVMPINATPLPTNTWVRVTGTWAQGGGVNNDRAIPWIKLKSVKPIPQPKNPYE